MRPFKSSAGEAHGKLILIGEHAVVYHEPAIALPFFPVSVIVRVEASEENSLNSALYQGPLEHTPEHLKHISQLIINLQKEFDLPNLRVYIESSIPVSAGMGSSAAIASALVQAIYAGVDAPLSLSERIFWTQRAERIAHGNPSGIDAYTTSFDSAWWFIKDQALQAFDIQLDAVLIVANSEIQGSTKEAVTRVAQRLSSDPSSMSHIKALGQLTHQARLALDKHEADALGALLTQAHRRLQQLNVSHPQLDAMVETALQAGALGAKMTGGGLGGCIIALAHSQDDAQHIVSALKKHTFSIWTHSLS